MKSETLQQKAVKNSPLAKKIIVWACIILMIWSTLGVYIVYMFAPKQEPVEESLNPENDVLEILPENIDSENPYESQAPILVTEDWEVDEMDRSFEVQLENGETELIRVGDLSDSIQIN